MNITDGIKSDQEELGTFFSEKAEFEFYSLGKTYSQHQLLSIDGVPVEEGKKPIFYFYRDDIYIPMDKRDPDYKGSLIVFDYAGQAYTAKYYYQNKLKKSEFEFEGLSIHDVLQDLYTNAKRG